MLSRRILAILIGFAALPAQSLPAQAEVGFREIELPGPRPLHVAIWYPTTPGVSERLVADNPVFVGFNATPGAPVAPGAHRLVVMSHGYGGSWANLGWLGAALAQRGFVVAAPNHPGTTTRDMAGSGDAVLAARPRDLTRVIDAVLATPDLAATVDDISVVGHSLGGWTGVTLVGGRFDPAVFRSACRADPAALTCAEVQGRNAGIAPAASGISGTDARVTRLVALDPGVTRGFTPASLAAITTPTLVIAAGTPAPVTPGLRPLPTPDMRESADLVGHMAARARLLTIADANHFSFLAACKPGAAAMIAAANPAEGVICAEAQRPRAAIQAQVIDVVASFLAEPARR